MHRCNLCDKEFISSQKLGSHKRVHTLKYTFCEICNVQILNRHFEKHKNKCERKGQCAYCNQEISFGKKFCNSSCSSTFSNLKRKHTSLTKKKISLALRLKQRIKKEHKIICELCQKHFDFADADYKSKRFCSRECSSSSRKINLSKSLKGRTGGPRVGGGAGKKCIYQGIKLDSTWELEFAKRLDALNIPWIKNIRHYSFKYIDKNGNERNYYPDFLIQKDVFIEIKGYWTDEIKHKISYVILNYPINLIVLDSLDEIKQFMHH